MKEIVGNIFDIKDADAICVTTNFDIKQNGELVMGKGIALEFANRYPSLPYDLGALTNVSRRVHGLYSLPLGSMSPDPRMIISFPTKFSWRDKKSNLLLICKSAMELRRLADDKGFKKVMLPRPGCSNGRLTWEEVKPHIERILDDRFYIITEK